MVTAHSASPPPRLPASRGTRPPGPRGRLILGHTFDYIRDPLAFLTRCARDHGDIVRLRLGTSTAYLVSHPDLISEVLRTHATEVIKDELTRLLIPLVGHGLLTSEGDFWRRQRKLATPAFQHQQIAGYGATMVDLAQGLSETWGIAARDGQPRNVHDDFGALTLAIVGKTLFGGDVGDAARRIGPALAQLTEYYLNPYKWFRIREWLPTRENRAFRASVRLVDETVYDLIRRRRAQPVEEHRDDLLEGFLRALDDDGSGMTDAQLRDECVTLFLAGHETTALALSFVFHLLAHHPEVDERLAQELESVLGDRPATAADVERLDYTEAVVREAMRLYPPAWGIGREAVVPFTLGGYPVPKGTQLIIAQWVTHRDPRWWTEPEAFRPERWENDLARRLPRGVYLPFGDGPRICIGNHFAMMELILVLATLARRYRVEPVEGDVLGLIPSITLRPNGGTRMFVRPRR
ncbi:MAG: cytochrome P450 [Isosphaeraceae bacterium]